MSSAALSSFSNFYCFTIQEIIYLQKRDFLDSSLQIRMPVITCLLCASVKVTPLLHWLTFVRKSFEGWNNRGTPPRRKLLHALLWSSWSDFFCFKIQGYVYRKKKMSSKKDISRKFSRVRKNVITCTLWASVKVTPLFAWSATANIRLKSHFKV